MPTAHVGNVDAVLAEWRAKGLIAPEQAAPVRAIAPAGMSEKEFMADVIAFARRHGWEEYHTHNSKRSTPGFPDLVLRHEGRKRLIVAELKVGDNVLTPDQEKWLLAFADAGVQTFAWWPDSWGEIVKTLAEG